MLLIVVRVVSTLLAVLEAALGRRSVGLVVAAGLRSVPLLLLVVLLFAVVASLLSVLLLLLLGWGVVATLAWRGRAVLIWRVGLIVLVVLIVGIGHIDGVVVGCKRIVRWKDLGWLWR